MSISASRLNELIEDYKKLKTRVDGVDKKYSLDYNEPLLDMPESLNLQKLVYSPKTREELSALAEDQVAPYYFNALARLDESRAKSLQKIQLEKQALSDNNRAKLEKLLYDFEENCKTLRKRLADNGILFSSVIDKAIKQEQDKYHNDVYSENASFGNSTAALDARKADAESNYNAGLDNLNAVKFKKEETALNELVRRDNQEKISVDKYNNQLEEKENKYQYSRAKALESARQAENNRAFAARKLYQQMGAVGYQESLLSEKLAVFKTYFSSFTKREEALALIQSDNFARAHLQDYYSLLVDWINRTIPA